MLQIEIKDLIRNCACLRSDRTVRLCRQRYCREARNQFAEGKFRAQARFRFNQYIITYIYIIFTFITTSFLPHYCVLEIPLLQYYYMIIKYYYRNNSSIITYYTSIITYFYIIIARSTIGNNWFIITYNEPIITYCRPSNNDVKISINRSNNR